MFQGMRYVYEVYREMSFSKAAQKLYISQPSLSAAVKREEALIGYPIFDRSTTPIRLTALGEQYIRTAEIIMGAEDSFREYLNDLAGLRNGSLSIGGTTLFASYVLPPLISGFTAHYPAVHIDLLEASTAELTEKLLAGTLDLMIDNKVMDPEIYSKTFFCDEHLLLTVPARLVRDEALRAKALTADEVRAGAHRRPETPGVMPSDFPDAPFLLLRPGNDTRTRADSICGARRFAPRVCLELDQQVTAYNLSVYGMGIAFVGDMLIDRAPPDAALLYYRIDSPDAVRSINLYRKRSRYLSQAVRAFLELSGR